MHIIVYTSELASDEDDVNKLLADVVAKSKINNPRRGISGLLFYHNGRFLQIIEGEHDALEQLMSILQQDSRHKDIVRIIDEDIYQRSFAQWNMDSLNLSPDETIDLKELEIIRDVIKRNMDIDTGILAEFYKAMLATHELMKPGN